VIKLRQQHETKLQISREVRDFGEFVRVENSYDYRLLQKNSREVVVGVERFELPTSCSQRINIINNINYIQINSILFAYFSTFMHGLF